LDEATTLKASAGVYHQSPIDAWKVPSLQPQQALGFTLGGERKLIDALSLSLEGFYKDLSSLVIPPDTLGFTEAGGLAPLGPELSNDGAGRVYGAELLLRHDLAHNFFGWVAYTLSRSERRRAAGRDFQLFD